MKLAITSDLHFNLKGHPTPAHEIDALIVRIAADRPDAVVIAGDVAHGYASFEACVAKFRGLEVPVYVLAGNHDIWRDHGAGHSSEALWGHLLREACERQGAVWLEDAIATVAGVGLVGSLAWYDYSAIDPEFAMPVAQIREYKRFLNNDARCIDWQRGDVDFAGALGDGLCRRLAAVAKTVDAVVVVTHVPLLEAQMVRASDAGGGDRANDPGDDRANARANPRDWGVSNAYFGNLTLGRRVLEEPKVRAVVSGHTHQGKRENVDGVAAVVVGSDYGRPVHFILEL